MGGKIKMFWVIKDFLGTTAVGEEIPKGSILVDIRDLNDGQEDPLKIKKKVLAIIKCLSTGNPVIIQCLAGISRSNAIAVTTLCHLNGRTWDDNEALVKSKVGRTQINLSLKDSCKKAVGEY